MGRRLAGQWAYYLQAMIMAGLFLMWQPPGTTFAAGFPKTWKFTVTFSGTGTLTCTNNSGGALKIQFNFSVRVPNILLVDSNYLPDPLEEPIQLCYVSDAVDVTGSYTEENYDNCDAQHPQCCPNKFSGTIKKLGDTFNALIVNVNKNYLYVDPLLLFQIQVIPDADGCGAYKSVCGGITTDYECPAFGYILSGILSDPNYLNGGQGVELSVARSLLNSNKKIVQIYPQFTMNDTECNNAGFAYGTNNQLTWQGTLEMDVISSSNPAVLKLLLLD
jgi:hypothetical protein